MKKIAEKISNKTQFPIEIISSTPKIEVTGNKMIYIENHKGVKILTPENVTVKLTTGLLVIEGEKIAIHEIDKEHIFLTGIFNSFKFDKFLE